MLFQHEGVLYKFIKSHKGSAADQWVYSGNLKDVWSTMDDGEEAGTGISSLKIVEYDESNELTLYSQVYEDQFLFDLTHDESELINLLNPDAPGYDVKANFVIIKECEALIENYRNSHELFSAPMDMLHTRL